MLFKMVPMLIDKIISLHVLCHKPSSVTLQVFVVLAEPSSVTLSSRRLGLQFVFLKEILLTLVGLHPLRITINLLTMPRRARRWPLRYGKLLFVQFIFLLTSIFNLVYFSIVSKNY